MADRVAVRAARFADIAGLPDLESRAAARFDGPGFAGLVLAVPHSLAAFTVAQARGRLLVAAAPGAAMAGFILLDLVDGDAFVVELAVDPACAGRRLGARLLDAAAAWGGARNCRWLTLTTYRAVPWNAPYYRRLGFAEPPTEACGPQLRRLIALEARLAGDPALRVALRRPINFPAAPM